MRTVIPKAKRSSRLSFSLPFLFHRLSLSTSSTPCLPLFPLVFSILRAPRMIVVDSLRPTEKNSIKHRFSLWRGSANNRPHRHATVRRWSPQNWIAADPLNFKDTLLFFLIIDIKFKSHGIFLENQPRFSCEKLIHSRAETQHWSYCRILIVRKFRYFLSTWLPSFLYPYSLARSQRTPNLCKNNYERQPNWRLP